MKLRFVGIALIVLSLGFGAIYGSKYFKEYTVVTNEEEALSLEDELKRETDEARKEYLASTNETDSGEENLDEDYTGKVRVLDSDVVAKLTINACNIDAFVYENEEDDYYLHNNAKGENSRHGEIYTNCYDCKVPIIYGHHMKDGTMFASLDCAYVGAEITLEDIGYLEELTRTYKVTSVNNDVPASKVWDLLDGVDSGLVLITCSYGVDDGRLVLIAN